MAEVTAMRNNALPYPIYGAPWVIAVPLLDADGDPISPSSPDSERSLNGDTFADCTNELVEIATSSGMCYLILTAAEMTADVVSLWLKSTGAKSTMAALYPRKLVTIRSGTSASAGSSTSTIVFDASASAVDDFYNGMVCIATIDSNVEVRVISDYTGSTQTATVVPDWNVAPDNNDTFVIKLPEGPQIHQANVSHWNSLAAVELPLVPTTAGRKLDVSAGGEAGVDWANVGSPTTSLALTGTTIAITQKVDVDTIKTNPVVNGGTATFPTNATLASTTNITAGTITTVTNLTNAPTNGDLTSTMKTSVTTAATAATPVAASVTGNVGGNVAGSVGSVTGLTASNLDATISSRLAASSYTAPDNSGIAGIATLIGTPADTDLATDIANISAGSGPTAVEIREEIDANSTKLADILLDTGTTLPATLAAPLPANVKQVNDVTITGNGQTGTEWGPV